MKVAAVEEGMLTVLKGVLQLHIVNPEVCAHALWALTTLAFHPDNRPLILDLGFFPLIKIAVDNSNSCAHVVEEVSLQNCVFVSARVSCEEGQISLICWTLGCWVLVLTSGWLLMIADWLLVVASIFLVCASW